MTHPLAAATAATIAVLATGCGERDEPSPSAIPPPTADDASAFEIIGTWEGRLQQQGLKPFRVTATIASLDDSPDNRVHYTGIDCGGHWEYVGRNATSYTFREVIDEGETRVCKGTGKVRLAPTPDGRLYYLFRGGGIASRGVLTRTG